MKGNLYKFTIEHLDSKSNTINSNPLTFKVRNHEDIFKIVEKMKQKKNFDEEDATSLVVGLKLFGSIILKNRDNAPFKQLFPHFKEFMKELKKSK